MAGTDYPPRVHGSVASPCSRPGGFSAHSSPPVTARSKLRGPKWKSHPPFVHLGQPESSASWWRRLALGGVAAAETSTWWSPPAACSIPMTPKGSHHDSVDAARGWRSHSAVSQHSGLFPAGCRSHRARPGYQPPGAPGSPPLP